MNIAVMFLELGKGFITTVEIFMLTLIFSLPLGLIISFGRMSKNCILRTITKFYISVMRGTPLMLQLIVVYFGPFYVFGLQLSRSYRFIAVILAFVLNYAAYFAEIYRSGIESMPKGQYEAAKVLGYTKGQTFFKIILPQVIKRVMPSITNETITLVKDTSLAFVLSIVEMFTTAKQIAASETTIMPLMVAGLFYYIFNLAVALGMELIERKLNYYR
ncbi:amino acid ABC transporter permease [Anaerocolumna aminovalerica]|jgi:polar amino acid transport system permease protein|uniref:Amino acid ABC transporter membrane protein, PAAT family n=1 Tax=Anaerocolumna aminovalerica TaxID=1527 RepID=A0A1I5FJN5_9FIRM|nr:amino acid ABC transporter permease [Anaerocolumna aminovalerica]MBU5330977.1 amino acid ABC transporter permease [Anaerocolumna aminovalerica]MDU6264687.1 amino acid ABC transporter permease [Anaerocolumna aminovalerica]SFO23853.1 amino acid ABC transporter membrane protein, PAAT family [Anaerocolumna aminovalerica]